MSIEYAQYAIKINKTSWESTADEVTREAILDLSEEIEQIEDKWAFRLTVSGPQLNDVLELLGQHDIKHSDPEEIPPSTDGNLANHQEEKKPKTDKRIIYPPEKKVQNEIDFEIKINPISEEITADKLKGKIQQALNNKKSFWWFDSNENMDLPWTQKKGLQKSTLHYQDTNMVEILMTLNNEDLVLAISNGFGIGILEVQNKTQSSYCELNGLFHFVEPIAISSLSSIVDLPKEFLEPATLVDKLYLIEPSAIRAVIEVTLEPY